MRVEYDIFIFFVFRIRRLDSVRLDRSPANCGIATFLFVVHAGRKIFIVLRLFPHVFSKRTRVPHFPDTEEVADLPDRRPS